MPVQYLGLVLTTKNPEKFSEFLSDFKIAKIANQYFPFCSYLTVLNNISRLLIG
jgi:hypothetical protein